MPCEELITLITDIPFISPVCNDLVSSDQLVQLTAPCLEEVGISYARIKLVSMSSESHQREFDRFIEDPECTVLLVATNRWGLAGLPLTEATDCFILDHAMDNDLEKQAAARIHCLGQKNSCRMVRILAEGTVDVAILKLRQKILKGEVKEYRDESTNFNNMMALEDILIKDMV